MESHTHDHNIDIASTSQGLVKDPVCGMMIDPETAKGGNSIFNEKTYSFWSVKCKTKFMETPQNYLETKTEIKLQEAKVEV